MALRRVRAALVAVFVAAAGLVPVLLVHPGSEPAAGAPRSLESARAALAHLPLAFESVRGGYLARSGGAQLYLDGSGTSVALSRGGGRAPALIRTRFLGARHSRPVSEDRLRGVINELRGQSRHWRTNVPTYERVRYRGLYPGVDALFHGDGSRLEYDFVVSPGASASPIAFALNGADSLRVTRAGDLLIRTGASTVRQARPVTYQRIDGQRVAIRSRFRVQGRHISFDVGRYDHSKPLVIDPVMDYSTFLGGAGGDSAESIALGPDGTIYIAGWTSSNNFPAINTRPNTRTDEDALVVKLTSDGSSLVYANIYGGATKDTTTTSAEDHANDIAVDGFGNAFVTGYTGSTDFPEEPASGNDLLTACNAAGTEAFVLWIDNAGVTKYLSCLGGLDNQKGDGVAVSSGQAGTLARVAVVGRSTTTTAWGSPEVSGYSSSPSGNDAFVAEVTIKPFTNCDHVATPCETLRYRTFLPGATSDGGAHAVAYDGGGKLYLTGEAGNGFPGGTSNGQTEAYVAKVDPSTPGANSLVYAHYYGTDGWDVGRGIAVDSSNNAYVVGDTLSTNPLPKADTSGNLVRGQGTDGFIAQFDPSGDLVRSTYVGGSGEDTLDDIVVQRNGSGLAEYAVGSTESSDLPIHNPIDGQSCATAAVSKSQIMVVKRIDGAQTPGAIVSCVGGNQEDHGTGVAVPFNPLDGTIYLSGWSRGNYPTVNAYQASQGSTFDGVVSRLTQAKATITQAPPALIGDTPAHFTFAAPDQDMGFACTVPDGTGHLVAGSPRTPAACGGTAGGADISGLADGSQTLEVASSDAFGSQSKGVSSYTFEVDRTPPAAFELKSPLDNESLSTSPTFTWAEATDAHGIGTYQLVIDDKTVQTVSPAACVAGTCSAHPAGVLNGAHTWKVIASDGVSPANQRSSATRTVTIGDPAVARFSIAPNPVLAGGKVTFDGSASNDATHEIKHYEWDLDGNGTFETDGGASPQTSKSYGTPGTVSVGLRVTDGIGLVATSSQDLRINAPTIPEQVGVSINKGAQYTNKPNVTLTIVAPASATSLLIANDGGFVGALPQAIAREVPWKLDSSGPERLPKTVYLRFLINTFASPNYTDDIILDERPPVVDSASLAGAPASTSAATAAKLTKFKVKVKAHDTNSGVQGVQITTNKRKPGKLLKYAKTVTVKLASRPKFIRAKDKAGNFSGWKKLR